MSRVNIIDATEREFRSRTTERRRIRKAIEYWAKLLNLAHYEFRFWLDKNICTEDGEPDSDESFTGAAINADKENLQAKIQVNVRSFTAMQTIPGMDEVEIHIGHEMFHLLQTETVDEPFTELLTLTQGKLPEMVRGLYAKKYNEQGERLCRYVTGLIRKACAA